MQTSELYCVQLTFRSGKSNWKRTKLWLPCLLALTKFLDVSVLPYVKLVNNKVMLDLRAFPLLCGKMKQLTVIVYRKHAITVGLKVYVTVQVLIQDIPNNLCRFWMGGYLSVVVIEVFFFFGQKYEKDFVPLKSKTYEVLNEGRSMIGDGYFDKGEEEHFQDRMDNVDKRMQNLLEQSQRDHNKWAWYIYQIAFAAESNIKHKQRW